MAEDNRRTQAIQALKEAAARAEFSGEPVKISPEACRIIVDMLAGQDWISVKDGMPERKKVEYEGETWEESDEVLVWIPEVPEPFRHICVAYVGSDGSWESNDGDFFLDYNVTHWMPLPERPQ